MKLKELDNNGAVQGYVLIKSCERKNAKNGSVYLDLSVADGDGDMTAKMWDFKGTAENMPAVNTVVLIRGLISTYNNMPQLRIDRFRPLNDTDNVNLADFIPSAAFEGEYMFNELLAMVNCFEDEMLKKLVFFVLNDYKQKILDLPAAFKLHHAVRGGLLMHTLSICKLALKVAELYPSVDKDLLISGAVLHDIAKSDEFSLAPTGLVEGYTVEGTLVGHLVKGAMIINETGKRLGIDENTLMLVEHMLISHHGKPEFGAAVRPLFLEAQILSALDTLDADIYEIENAVKEVEPGAFTNRMWALDDRRFYNHGRKTVATDVNL